MYNFHLNLYSRANRCNILQRSNNNDYVQNIWLCTYIVALKVMTSNITPRPIKVAVRS